MDVFVCKRLQTRKSASIHELSDILGRQCYPQQTDKQISKRQDEHSKSNNSELQDTQEF